MTTSSDITDYLGVGAHSARPGAPNVPAGGTAVYYETDTANTFAWDGSAWQQINGGGGGGGSTPVLVQHGAAMNSDSVTLGSAPTSGNLLFAMCSANSPPGAGSGWEIVFTDGGGNNQMYAKVAGASESATQTPCGSTPAGALSIFEINGGTPGPICSVRGGGGSTAVPIYVHKTTDLIVGAFLNAGSTDILTSVTGATVGDTVIDVGSGRSANNFFKSSPSVGVDNLVLNWSGSPNAFGFGCCIVGI